MNFALTGVLNTYTLTIQYNTYSTLSTFTTGAAGTYSFTGLDAGSYTVTPTQAGKVFSPTAKSAVIGPSKTGFNFTRTN